MARFNTWFPAFAIAVLALAAPDLASAQVKTGTTAGVAAPVVKKVVKRARLIDPSIASCKMFGSDGKTARPGVTHMTQGDHARVRAEHMMIREASKGNGDEAVYYDLLTGDSTNNPKLNRFRVDDSLGRKKGCLLTGTR
jgi:hypothetical protein